MKIAISGLGRMGSQIVNKLIEADHSVIANNRSRDPIDEAVRNGAIAAYDKQSVVDSFNGQPVILWLMIPANVVDTELDKWLDILPNGSIIIDGGNSDYRGDEARSQKAITKGCTMVDIGTSGGVWGVINGFSMMVGGDEKSFKTIAPALETLSLPRGGYQYFGPAGSGHYVKMVHNAIEYGMMESLAEGYQMLAEGPYKDLDLAKAGDVWQQSSVVTSWLNDLTREALHENPTLEGISGIVAESGETRWTLETAKELGIKLPSIEASFDVRLASQRGETTIATKLLAAMRNKFGGHNIDGKL